MATLPTFADLGERPVPQASPQIAGYEPPNWRQVGMAGDAVSGAGQAIAQAGQIVEQTNERQDLVAAQAGVNQLQQARTNLEFDPNTGFRNVKEGNAANPQFTSDYMAKFQDAQSAISDGLSNPRQQQLFAQHAQVAQLQYQSALLAHQAQETDKFNDSTADATTKLALQSMATRPMDEMNFQTGMATINGTIDQLAQRKGLPAATVAHMKATYLDGAYTTRIKSILDGIPGVVQSDPYTAEKMFQQVQGQLSPVSQITLAGEVQKGIKQVQNRDIAQRMIFGDGKPLDPSTLAPAIGDAKPLQDAVLSMESNGKRLDATGNLVQGPVTASGERAQGEMQVMPYTAANPGFGVRPAQPGPDGKISPDEYARVGRDYLGAMTARYQDPALVFAAYNAGPGQVDKWIQKFGDPRTGTISDADWAAKVPFAETRQYVINGMQKVAGATPGNPAAVSAPTANELKTQLPAKMEQARSLWNSLYPNDPVGADAAAARVGSYGQMVIANEQARQAGARDQLFRGIVGQKPDGSDAPRTIDSLLADPASKDAWSQATPETQLAIQQHFKNGGGDPPRSNDTQRTVYNFMGMAVNDREQFAKTDLSPLIPLLPHADFDKLATLQLGARNKQELAADKQANLTHALTLANDFALKPIGLGIPDKNTPQTKRDQYNQFTGALMTQMDQFQTANGKAPNDQQIVSMAKNLTAQVQTPGTWFGTNSKPAFQINPQTDTKFLIPPDFRAGITQSLTKALGGKAPTEAQIQTAYLLHVRPDLKGQ